MTDIPEAALLKLILTEQSESAFRALHRRYAERLHRIALRMLGSDADSEDAVQESWLRAVRRLADFRGDSAFGTWLTAILINVCREHLDRAGRWNHVELEDDALVTEPDAGLLATDLETAIAALPGGMRAAFILHDVEGYTHDDIARHFGYTAGTSKSQVFRARRLLRRMLGSPEGVSP